MQGPMRGEKGSKRAAPYCNNSSVHMAHAKQCMTQQASEWDLAPFLPVTRGVLLPVWVGPLWCRSGSFISRIRMGPGSISWCCASRVASSVDGAKQPQRLCSRQVMALDRWHTLKEENASQVLRLFSRTKRCVFCVGCFVSEFVAHNAVVVSMTTHCFIYANIGAWLQKVQSGSTVITLFSAHLRNTYRNFSAEKASVLSKDMQQNLFPHLAQSTLDANNAQIRAQFL